MTVYELMVIAVAAGVFMIVNIIMWSVISHKEKKEEQNAVKAAAEAASQLKEKPAGDISVSEPETIHHEKPDSFIIEEDIVFIHTDEII